MLGRVLASAGIAVMLAGESRRDGHDARLPRLPERQVGDLPAAAAAAGCELVGARAEGAGHDDREFTIAGYRTNPPTSGDHNPSWYEDGIYAPDAAG